MIELEVFTQAGERRPVLLNVDNIGSVTPLADERVTIITRDGRELLAVGSYTTVRSAIVRVRSGFETLIGGAL